MLAWMSPSFPVGAYTYSHGLEWAIEAGDVCDADSLAHWCAGVLIHGAGRSDAILLAHAMTAAHAGDVRTLRDLLDLARALQPSAERRLEATAQGDAFIAAVRDAWPPNAASQAGDTPAQSVFATLTSGPEAIPRGGWSYPLAVAVSAAAHGLSADAVRFAYLHAFAANLVSAAVRAVPLGQTDGQRVLNRLGPVLRQVAEEAGTASLDEIGGCAFAADIASMNHETQYTRLFRS
ncbi:urease accessory protein UreF [Stappia sp.]|uniref:urease accessory protein UreF n=1 Tax=Stappia sp. TaxID=1870903 RepID=UPI0032D94971